MEGDFSGGELQEGERLSLAPFPTKDLAAPYHRIRLASPIFISNIEPSGSDDKISPLLNFLNTGMI